MTLKFVDGSGAKTRDYWLANKDNSGEPAQRDLLIEDGADAALVTVFVGATTWRSETSQRRARPRRTSGSRSRCPNSRAAFRRSRRRRSCCRSSTTTEQGRPARRHVRQHPAPGAHARIIVQGYPRLFPEKPYARCSTGLYLTYFELDEQEAINKFEAKLNARIQKAAERAGVDYIDVSNLFADHDLCKDDDQVRWANRLHNPGKKKYKQEGFHPTIAGQAALAGAIVDCFKDTADCTAVGSGSVDEDYYTDPTGAAPVDGDGWYGLVSTETIQRKKDQIVYPEVTGEKGHMAGHVIYLGSGCGDSLKEKRREGTIVLFDAKEQFGFTRCGDGSIALNFKDGAVIYRSGSVSGLSRRSDTTSRSR